MTYKQAYRKAKGLVKLHGEAGVIEEYPGEFDAVSWRTWQADETLSERQLVTWLEDSPEGIITD